MPNFDNLRPYPKGVSGNPGGRPKSLLTSEKFRSLVFRLGALPYSEVVKLADSDDSACFERMVASIMKKVAETGDASRMTLILDRTIGRPKELIEEPESDEKKGFLRDLMEIVPREQITEFLRVAHSDPDAQATFDVRAALAPLLRLADSMRETVSV